jgi:hypothetical protein
MKRKIMWYWKYIVIVVHITQNMYFIYQLMFVDATSKENKHKKKQTKR